MKFTKYLADTLSLLRAAAAIPVIAFAVMGNWHAAFLCLVVGWATDLVDGIAARRYGTVLSAEFDADGKADSVLAFGASAVPVVYAYGHYSPLVAATLTVAYVATCISALAMISIMNKPLTPARRWLIASNMIIMHGIVQIGATLLWFDYMAAGTDNAMRLAATLLGVGVFQHRKIRLWWVGRFS